MNTQYFNSIEDAIEDLKQGKVIIICDDVQRENEGDFVALADTITPETINFMITHAKGLLCAPISQKIATKFNLYPMTEHNNDNFATAFTISIDHQSNSTGISAFDRYTTIKHLTNQSEENNIFRKPGHVFPLIAKNNGVLERMGHTEATIDLAKLCHANEVGVICEIINPDGNMARRDDLFNIAQALNLKIICISDLVTYRKINQQLVECKSTALLPSKFGNFVIKGYINTLNNEHACAIIKGDPNKYTKPPFVRIHSECLTGDVFQSLRCDCGEQLELALKAIEEEQQGIIIYLKQEGRGIGLINKLKAYELQEKGFDTFEANLKLGFNADMRDYFIAYQILKDLGIKEIQLATNNPQKIIELESYGIKVQTRLKLETTPQSHNISYLKTKREKFGHLT